MSVRQTLLGTYYRPGTVQGSGGTKINKELTYKQTHETYENIALKIRCIGFNGRTKEGCLSHMGGGNGEKRKLRGGLQVETGFELSLDGYSMCNCLEVSGSLAHSEKYLKWLELGGGECGEE